MPFAVPCVIPENPDLVVDTETKSVTDNVKEILEYLKTKNYLIL
jgi:adenylylsulfate kinase-like enzyme